MIDLEIKDGETFAKNYRGIYTDVKIYTNAYKQCLQEIDEFEFTLSNIQDCIGIHMEFLMNDLDYEKQKLTSKFQDLLRQTFKD